ncbi:hypothetical protein CASFOL_021947 [Castilleja foliolosa]|uniref:F-box domain-containing protein n=1 Tax=Castilleja foliolosa TaxID=1961234 RepID=A0ABD3CYW2_9LAMI
MNKHLVKRRRRVDDDDGSAIAIDRLSQLPQPIWHSILSLLPQKDAVRTCVLSKSWRYLWHGRLNFEFCDNCFARKKEFWSFLDKTLQRYLDQNLSLQKFIVDIRSVVDFELLQKWIPMAITNMRVKSLNLILSGNSIHFPLPLVVFQSESLVELHLHLCDLKILESTDNVMLKNLQTLRLNKVYITDKILEKIISSCPLIENLGLLSCIGLKSIKLHKHHNIKEFRCLVRDDQTIIEIENTHTLESSLNLYSVQLPGDIFDNFSSFFPCLSELILHFCDGLKEFLLLSSSIKRLTIKTELTDTDRIKAFIDTPNIIYFEYSGDGFLPSIEFATTSNEWNSQITLCYKLEHSDSDAMSWFLELNKLLKALSQSHITLNLNLFHSKYPKLHIDDSYGNFIKPVVVEHLNLSGCFSSSSDPAIVNCFLRICRPRYMDMYGDVRANCNLAEYISKLIPDETGCFWLQDLEEVSIEVWNEKANEWRCIKGTILHALRIKQQIRFRLTWKEQLSKFT